MIIDIDDEIGAVHKYVVDLYSKKFPLLENSVTDVMDYFRVVKLIGNEMVCRLPFCCCSPS
jgi:RNA processing factor Prp31